MVTAAAGGHSSKVRHELAFMQNTRTGGSPTSTGSSVRCRVNHSTCSRVKSSDAAAAVGPKYASPSASWQAAWAQGPTTSRCSVLASGEAADIAA